MTTIELSPKAVEYMSALISVDDGENAPSEAVLAEVEAAIKASAITTSNTVKCVHEAPNCCVGCFEADVTLFRNIMGDVIRKV